MRNWFVAALLALPLTTLAASTAHAGGERATTTNQRVTHTDSSPRRDRTRNIEFEVGDDIDGDRADPDGSSVVAVPAARHGTLIEVRTSFRDRIVRTIDNL